MPNERPSLPWPGAQDHGDGRVTFTLYAPHKQRVHLIGDLNGWDLDADPLQSIGDGLWSIEKRLDPGPAAYQFVVDGDLTICDPYARAIAWQDDGPPHAIVEVGREPFAWRHTGWTRPPFHDLVLYELHVGDFGPEGTFREVIDRLDHLAALGVNALQLLPVTQGVRGDHWGYQPTFFFAVKQEYGTPDDLRTLVDEAHGRGMAVLFDLVLAHSSGECPLFPLYPVEESPWYSLEGIGGAHEFGFPTFDHRKPPTQAFSRDVQAYWIEAFRADGFRYDYAKNIGEEDGKGTPHLVRTAREFAPDAYLIGEYSPEDTEESNRADLSGSWHVTSSRCFKALLLEAEVEGMRWDDLPEVVRVLDARAYGYDGATQGINYIESHDEERLMGELKGAGFPEEQALHKALLGAVLLMLTPGQPQIYMGGEWGEASPKRLDRNPIHWETLESDPGRALFEGYRKAVALRRDHPALRAETYEFPWVDNDRKIVTLHRWNDEGDDLVAVANLKGEWQEVQVPWPQGGRWREIMSGNEVNVEEKSSYGIEPYTVSVFVRL